MLDFATLDPVRVQLHQTGNLMGGRRGVDIGDTKRRGGVLHFPAWLVGLDGQVERTRAIRDR